MSNRTLVFLAVLALVVTGVTVGHPSPSTRLVAYLACGLLMAASSIELLRTFRRQ